MKINRTKCKITGDNIWQINFTINNIKETTANVLKQANFIELISNVSKELVENINYDIFYDDYTLYLSNLNDDNVSTDKTLYLLVTKMQSKINNQNIIIDFCNSDRDIVHLNYKRIIFKTGHINIFINGNILSFDMVFQFLHINSKENITLGYLLRKIAWNLKKYIINL